jgi:hypothetical protein
MRLVPSDEVLPPSHGAGVAQDPKFASNPRGGDVHALRRGLGYRRFDVVLINREQR